ncbi:hypothetical protein [Thermus thermophilus HB8]|jgi:hypothetical protein|uniref:Uncharacterized protein n=1 Tax=Thermus thermophilus (strain ATCC 27634 / DSM 579 / HB8) TaxID=300852 RepID=Q5SI39_THET8|nr:hypothetical protein [Thermus thermophilus HB8]
MPLLVRPDGVARGGPPVPNGLGVNKPKARTGGKNGEAFAANAVNDGVGVGVEGSVPRTCGGSDGEMGPPLAAQTAGEGGEAVCHPGRDPGYAAGGFIGGLGGDEGSAYGPRHGRHGLGLG